MGKCETRSTTLDRPWEQVVQAVYEKYPNPHNKSARVSDCLSRSIDSEGRVVSVRYSGSKFPVPSIINSTFYKFTGIRFPELAYSYEYSIMDRENRTFRQYSKNTTMGRFLRFVETIEYAPTEDGKTCVMRQKWNVICMISSWMNGWFEGQFLNICTKNATDGINGVQWVADRLNSGELGAAQLAEFRETLKIFVDDTIHFIDDAGKQVEATVELKKGEISEKVSELYETVGHNVEQTTGEITQKVEEMFINLEEKIENEKDEITQKVAEIVTNLETGEITKKVAELCHDTADNVGETKKRLRHYSETKRL